jgi:hypothetical protein
MKHHAILLPAVVALSLVCCSQSTATIELSQDFDSGSLNVAASSVNGTTVNLVGRKTWTHQSYSICYRWVYFKASDVVGLQPRFFISKHHFLGDLRDHRYVWSYDRSDWHFFDNGDAGARDYMFSNNSPFTQNEVYVAYSLPYPVSRTEQYVGSIGSSPFVSPTASDLGGFVVGRSAGGIDDTGRTINPHDLYGFTITDPAATGDKIKVLLAGGNHSGEPMGNIALEGMTDFLLSDDPFAAQLRRAAEFFVYPQMNPDGRFAGYYRSGPENPDKDFNRYWNDPAGFTDMTAVRNAMLRDTGGDVGYLFDFHGFFGTWNRQNYFATIRKDVDGEFAQALARFEPDVLATSSTSDPKRLRNWGQSQAGLAAEHSFTVEFGPFAGMYEDRLMEMGANYARALHWVVVGVPEPTTLVSLLIGAATLALLARRRSR